MADEICRCFWRGDSALSKEKKRGYTKYICQGIEAFDFKHFESEMNEERRRRGEIIQCSVEIKETNQF